MHRKKNEWSAENVNMIQTYLFIQAQSNELYWLVYALGHVFSMRRTILQTIYEFYRESFVKNALEIDLSLFFQLV